MIIRILTQSRKARRGSLAFIALTVLVGVSRGHAESVCSPTPFVQADSFQSGGSIDRIAAGDFNGDEIPDIVGDGGSYISVMPGIGDGTFGPPIPSNASASDGPFVVADLDGDGKADLVVANRIDSRIRVLAGNGDGTFHDGPVYQSESARSLVLGDFDGDGKPDLAETTDFLETNLRIFKGNGNGTFQSPGIYTSPIPTKLLVADFNGDGRDDLAGPSEGEILIALSNPDGSPGTTAHLPVGSDMLAVIATDLDGDGKIDFVVSRNKNFEFFRGIGDGTFEASIQFPAREDTGSFLAIDADGDGLLDLVGLRFMGGTGTTASVVDVWHRLAGGGFAAPVGFQAPFPIGEIAVADFDGDGRPDFAGPGRSEERVAVLLARSDGLRASRSLRLDDEPAFLARADFDGDGYDELVVIGRLGESLWIVGRDANGDPSVLSKHEFPGAGLTEAVAADLSGDGKIDLIVGSFYANLYVLLGRGDGSFADPVPYVSPTGPNSLAVADFNGDGRLDLVFTNGGSTPESLQVWLGKGDGTFLPGIDGPSHVTLVQLTAGDLNGDGFADVVASEGGCCVGPLTISVFLGNGDGTLREAFELLTGDKPASVAIADADGDGHPDIVTADSGGTTATLLAGDGLGGFAAPVFVGVGWSPLAVIVQDLDGDGRNDFATANGGSSNGQNNSASVLLGRPGGAFDPPILLPTGSPPTAVVAGNFLGGPATDVATANPTDASISFFEGARLAASLAPGSAVVGATAVLDAHASGWDDVGYQWRRGGSPLVDGGRISGVHTAQLRIEGAQFSDAGSYDVVVTDSCGTATSNAASLSVEFADVAPADQFHAAILKVARAGITGGCGSGNYCPQNATTRGEMAVFLLRGEHGGAYQPAAATGMVFDDVATDTPFAKWIEQVAAEGITQGCGSGNYCPEGLVTRDQMAVFLLRAKHGGSFQPPAATGTVFSDVPADAPFAKWIERVAAEGISSGCGGGKYCPGDTVTRAQMAAFLARTFGLP